MENKNISSSGEKSGKLAITAGLLFLTGLIAFVASCEIDIPKSSYRFFTITYIAAFCTGIILAALAFKFRTRR